MNKLLSTLALLSLTSCATIVGLGPNEKVHIESSGGTSVANFIITNGDGQQVASGRTPMSVRLPAGTHYFQPERYTVHFTKNDFYPSYEMIETSINPWYFGNLIFGGIILGGLIVDPLTGAMWSLEDNVEGHLIKQPTEK